MKSAVSAEKLARIAGVKVETVRRMLRELFDLLQQDSEIGALSGDAE